MDQISKGKMGMFQWQHCSLISGCNTVWEQARTLAKHLEHSIEWVGIAEEEEEEDRMDV
jgi:hypothetical protein